MANQNLEVMSARIGPLTPTALTLSLTPPSKGEREDRK